MAQAPFPAATLIQAFELFYTRFILRDFVGKIVPGFIFLLLSFRPILSLQDIILHVRELNFMEGAALTAVAWLFSLCSQSIHSRLMYFYFPRIDEYMRIERRDETGNNQLVTDKPMWRYIFDFRERENVYAREVAEAYNFMREASPDEKAQYERYVVIKEACGNAMFCTLLGVFSYSLVTYFKVAHHSFAIFMDVIEKQTSDNFSETIVLVVWAASAFLMKQDNLVRQTLFIERFKARRYEHKVEFLELKKRENRVKFLYWLLRGVK